VCRPKGESVPVVAEDALRLRCVLAGGSLKSEMTMPSAVGRYLRSLLPGAKHKRSDEMESTHQLGDRSRSPVFEPLEPRMLLSAVEITAPFTDAYTTETAERTSWLFGDAGYCTVVNPDAGQITQWTLAYAAALGGAGVFAGNTMSDQFSVPNSGQYLVTFSGTASWQLWSVGDTYLIGAQKGTFDIAMDMGVQANQIVEVSLYESDLSATAFLGEVASDTLSALLDAAPASMGLKVGQKIWEAANVIESVLPEDIAINLPFEVSVPVYLNAGSHNWWFDVKSETIAAALGLSGCYASSIVQCTLDSITVEANFDLPEITGFYAYGTPYPLVTDGALLLSAAALAGSESIQKVEFYRDSNYNGVFDLASDELLGTDTSPQSGLYDCIRTITWSPGSQRFFARARDNEGRWSSPSSILVSIGSSPAQEGSDLSLYTEKWNDNTGDGDGIIEGNEPVGLEIRLINSSGSVISDIQGVLTSPLGDLNITADTLFWPDIGPGYKNWSSGDFDMFLNLDQYYNVPFSLHLTYEQNGTRFYQDLLDIKETFHPDGEYEPAFEVIGVTIDDSTTYDDNNNGDGIFQSGESVRFRPQIANTGTADAGGDVEVFLLPSLQDVLYTEDDISYPDLSAGSSAYPSSDDFRADAAYSFAGIHWVNLRVEWADGTRFVELPNAFSFDVQPAAWGYLAENAVSLGLVSGGGIVTTPMTIANYGSEPMLVTGFAVTDGQGALVSDTTTGVPSLVVPAGQSVDVDIAIDTADIDGSFVRLITFATDGRVRRPYHATLEISGFVAGDGTPVFAAPGSTGASTVDIGGEWVVWSADNDIFAYNVQTGEERQLTNDVAIQRNPRVSGDFVAWEDSRNQAEGETNYDIYGYDLVTDVEHAVATDAADEFLAGVDGAKVAFARFYHHVDRDGWYGSDLYNMWLFDRNTEASTNLTGFLAAGSNPMRSVTRTWPGADPDFGDDLIVWQEREVYWQADRLRWNERNNQVWTFGIGSDQQPVLAIAASSFVYDNGYSSYFPTADGQFAWIRCEQDADGDPDAVWVWSAGSYHREIHENDIQQGQLVLAMGGGFIVQDMRYTPGMFYWDMTSNQRSLLSSATPASYSTRMDGRSVVWRSVDDGSVFFAFIEQPDIAVASADMTFSNESPAEGESIEVSAVIRNLTDYNITDDITVRLYDGDPDAGGVQLGSDQMVSGGLAGQGQTTVTFTSIAVLDNVGAGDSEGHDMFVRLAVPGFDNPDNNTAHRILDVHDDDMAGPVISNVTIVEHDGDGDGIIGSDEQVRISWHLSDPSSIGSVELLIGGEPVTLDGDYFRVLGPLAVGPHTYEIRATDADNSPENVIWTSTFSVVNAEEITVIFDASSLADGQTSAVDFGTARRGNPGVDRIFIVRNDGQQVLTLGAISVPGGFTVARPADSVVQPGGMTHFIVTLSTGSPGTFTGEVTLANSDGDEGPFNFPIEGYVDNLLGDANGDGIVDAADFIELKRNFGRDGGAAWDNGDLDGNGDVDFGDLQTLTTNFGESLETVPAEEPTSPELTATDSVKADIINPTEPALPPTPVADAPDPDILAMAASVLCNSLAAGQHVVPPSSSGPANLLPPSRVAVHLGPLPTFPSPLLSLRRACPVVADVLQLAAPWWPGDSANREAPDEPWMTSLATDILGKPRKGRLDPIGLDVLAAGR